MLSFAFPSINPVFLELGPISIHWYGVSYVLGILFSYWYSKQLLRNKTLFPSPQLLKPEHMDDILTWCAAGIVVGGRLGYILFYNPAYYFQNPMDIFAIQEGGMSFHGGALGVLLALILFSYRNHLNLYKLMDVIAITTPVGIGLVRCANFINCELWGRITDLPWGVVFPCIGPDPRHPSQLYEAFLEGFLLFVLLHILTYRYRKLRTPGFITGSFIAFYGIIRTGVECFREPDQQIGYLAGNWLTMGMILSLPMIAAGVWLMLRAKPIDDANT